MHDVETAPTRPRGGGDDVPSPQGVAEEHALTESGTPLQPVPDEKTPDHDDPLDSNASNRAVTGEDASNEGLQQTIVWAEGSP